MAESRGRPGSHGPGGRNSNNNGNGNQGPDFGGGGDNDYGNSKPSVGRHNVKGYSHQSFGPQGLDFFGGANGYDKLTEEQRRRVARFRSPFAAFMHRFGSFLVPGVDSHLSIDPQTGELASVDEFDAIGMTTGIMGTGGKNPVGTFFNRGYQIANRLGYGAPTYNSTRPHSSFNNGSQGRPGVGSGHGFSGGGNPGGRPENNSRSSLSRSFNKSNSVYDQAQHILYPQEEENTSFGVGVSQGKSKVRRARNLSTLNVRRPRFGRG
ncbi:hypothetical protein [Kiloniella sp. EL199]|uniref:hypothetical protein n=1 Tax=Kiloniella sp. EL199 TaxID=2107581 RepID=UPI000EA25D4B|nr:hypothetical protein [Kiloniella sp. EL199]